MADVDDIIPDEDYLIVDESSRKNFILLPNIVFQWPGMSHTMFRLYCYYKMICGERSNGRCWTSIRTSASVCGMNKETVIASRNELVKCGLITVERKRTKSGNEVITVSIVDVWSKNKKWKLPQKDGEGGKGESLYKRIAVGKGESGCTESGNGCKSKENKSNMTDVLQTSERRPHISECSFFSEDDIPVKHPKPGLSEFHIECGRRFKMILEENGCIPGNKTKATLAEGFRLLELEDKVPQDEIKNVLTKYRKIFKNKFVVKVYTSADVRSEWNRIKKAVMNNGYEEEHHQPVDFEQQQAISDQAKTQSISHEDFMKQMGFTTQEQYDDYIRG